MKHDLKALEQAVKEAGVYGPIIKTSIDNMARTKPCSIEYYSYECQTRNCLYFIKRLSENSFAYFNHILNNIKQLEPNDSRL